MLNAFRSESIRIWRPSFLYGGIGVMVGFAALVSVFIFTAASSAGSAPPSPGQRVQFATVAQIAKPGGFLTALGTVSTIVGVALLAIWAIAVSTDYSTGLIRILVQAYPKRVTLLTAKIVALAAYTLSAATVTTLTVVLLARPLARLQGIDVNAWQTDFFAHLLRGYFSFTVAVLVWGLIGLMLAVLTRSSALAIGIGIGYLLVVESLVGIVAPDASPYLPGGTLTALVSGGTGVSPTQLAWSTALGLVALYGTIAAAISLLVFRARDITS
jgi:hypothetical protein